MAHGTFRLSLHYTTLDREKEREGEGVGWGGGGGIRNLHC
jgi:hypothetical protein